MNQVDREGTTAATLAEVARRHATRPALSVADRTLSYGELHGAARAIAQVLSSQDDDAAVGIVADRTAASYVALLGSVLAGRTYVPLYPGNSAQRSLQNLEVAGAGWLLAGDGTREAAGAILAAADVDSRDRADTAGLHAFKLRGQSATVAARSPSPERPFYVLFTSGSTGVPKGVAVSESNLSHYLAAAGEFLRPQSHDRFSQTFQLTFDLSMHDIFLAWTSGAHLVAATADDLAEPAGYIRRNEISCWFSVPSLAYVLQAQGHLTQGAFPSLRTSCFCGEALPSALAQAWRTASPNSTVENLYGPTEATIACTRYVVRGDAAGTETPAIVPIGTAFGDTRTLVCDPDLQECTVGDAGELLLGGPQVALGYLEDPDRTAASFVTVPGHPGRYYRTGDRVVLRDGTLHFLGRNDAQIKLRGYRIELGEIEAALRTACGDADAVALAWPPEQQPPQAIVAAVESRSGLPEQILADLARVLPAYMMPTQVVCMARFPKNTSGKTDRHAIATSIADTIDSAWSAVPEGDAVGATLLSLIHDINPALERRRIETEENLLAAGMDSLGFVALMSALEQRFAVALDQALVESLSQMPFARLVDFVSGTLSGADIVAADGGAGLPPRANRVIGFIERFPACLDAVGGPLCLAVGSSGMLRAFDPATFETTACARLPGLRSFNVGLPAITAEGVAMVCRFIRETCERAGRRIELAIYELDPMHLGKLRPGNDIDVDQRFFDGTYTAQPAGNLDVEFEWDSSSRGRPPWDLPRMRGRVKARYARKRDADIAATFLGHNEFRLATTEHWLRGARELAAVSDRLTAFVQPLNGTRPEDSDLPPADNHYLQLLERVRNELGIEILTGFDFDLDDDDFLNFNHVNPWQGIKRISAQLAERLLPPD